MKRLGNRWLHFGLVLVAVGAGVWGLGHATSWWIAGAVVALAVFAAFAAFNEIAGRLLGGIVCGTLVLFGFNVALDSLVDALHWDRYSIIVGLVLALVVFGCAAAWYLRGSKKQVCWRVGKDRVITLSRGDLWPMWPTAVSASAMAVLFIVVAPIVADRGTHSAVPVLVGLVAGLSSCGIGYAMYRGLLRGRQHHVGGVVLAAVGVVAIGLVPLLMTSARGEKKVLDEKEVASRIDVRIVTDGSVHDRPPTVTPDPALSGFDVIYSAGYADHDGQVHWTAIGKDAQTALNIAAEGRNADPVHEATQGNAAPAAEARPVTRPDADAIVVLVVDGTPPVFDTNPATLPGIRRHREPVGRWRAIGHRAREPRMPTFALIQSNDPHRLTAWDHFNTSGGGYVSLQKLGRRSLTDAALALGIGAPTSLADDALAVAHRPILLFDSGEPVPRPLSIDWLFTQGDVYVCHDSVRRSTCDEQATTDPAHLRNGGTHLKLKLPDKSKLQKLALDEQRAAQSQMTGQRFRSADDAGPGAPPPATPEPAVTPSQSRIPTTIYVHPVPVNQGGRQLLYLDYWWFLQDNPVVIGKKAFCGAGLVIPGKTCHSHESDWEGMTVVIDRSTGTPKIKSVRYAEHNDVVSFAWPTLREGWKAIAPARAAIASADNGANRPVAFVAQGTHSTYPQACDSGECKQLISAGTGEARYNGKLSWLGNFTNTCGAISCVQALPTRTGGTEPALWNAFTGTWGKRHCVLTYYCDTIDPPQTPGQQKRYKHPARCTAIGSWDTRRKKFITKPGSCDG